MLSCCQSLSIHIDGSCFLCEDVDFVSFAYCNLTLLSLQVSKIAAYAYSAISQIKVDAKEELVVQFAIP